MIRRWDKSKPPTGPFVLNLDCPQAQGLIAWWPMGDAGLSYVPDRAGISHLTAGTKPGAATILEDGHPALTFTSASSQYLGVTLATGATGFSAGAWFKTTTTAAQQWIIGCGTATTTKYWGLAVANDGKLRSQVDGQTTVPSAAIATIVTSANVLHHGLMVSASTTSTRIYQDGVRGTDSALNIGPNAPNQRGIIEVGALFYSGTRGSFFSGSIGEIQLWNRILTDDDARRLAQNRFELWYPLRSRKWIVGAAATAPSITALSAINITATSAQPRISYS